MRGASASSMASTLPTRTPASVSERSSPRCVVPSRLSSRQTFSANDPYLHEVPNYQPYVYGEKEGGGTQVLVLAGAIRDTMEYDTEATSVTEQA